MLQSGRTGLEVLVIKPFHHLDPVVPELTWIHGTTCDRTGQETFWSLAEVSTLLRERGPPPEAGEGERQKAGNAGLCAGLAMEGKVLAPRLCKCSFLLWHRIKAVKWQYGPGVQCGKQHLAICLAVQPSSSPKES